MPLFAWHRFGVRPDRRADGLWATTAIDGVEAVLLDIDVVLAARLRIDHVELTGRTPDGATVVEQIQP